jgi:hypothetical protein
MSTGTHLLTLWHPSYAHNAMDEHLRVLRDWARRFDDESVADEELYVWWGKVKSPNRQQPMAHGEDARAVGRAAREGAEVHLYLTDYRSLYVGELLDVVDGELNEREQAHAPSYYLDQNLRCDVWFKLGDIRRLVADDTLLVVEELKKLRNVCYNDRPVSLYGGMVDLPLVVTRPDDKRFFDPDDRELLIGERLWAEFDADTGAGLAGMERELRENRFGDTLWLALEPEARTFIATGERIFRDHRQDPAFDFAPVLASFAKAIEVQANSILRRVLPKVSKSARLANLEGQTVDLTKHRALGLGELARALGGEHDLYKEVGALLRPNRWFVEGFPSVADAFREVRNPGVHAEVIDRATAIRWRNQLVGVGCEGDLVKLAAVRVSA